jgi:hypothetical protein
MGLNEIARVNAGSSQGRDEGIGGISYLLINTMRFLFAGVKHS